MLALTVSAAASDRPIKDGGMTAATRFLLVSVTSILLSLPVLAQSTAGRILGSVTDQSGAAVAGATVVVTDAQRGSSRRLTTDDSGGYSAPDLQPGVYMIHVEAKGFKNMERPNIGVEVATDVRLTSLCSPGKCPRR